MQCLQMFLLFDTFSLTCSSRGDVFVIGWSMMWMIPLAAGRSAWRTVCSLLGLSISMNFYNRGEKVWSFKLVFWLQTRSLNMFTAGMCSDLWLMVAVENKTVFLFSSHLFVPSYLLKLLILFTCFDSAEKKSIFVTYCLFNLTNPVTSDNEQFLQAWQHCSTHSPPVLW